MYNSYNLTTYMYKSYNLTTYMYYIKVLEEQEASTNHGPPYPKLRGRQHCPLCTAVTGPTQDAGHGIYWQQ